MVNIIWGVFIIIGVVFSFFNGRIDLINNEIITSGKTALNLLLEMLPMLALWMGLMGIAEDSGLLKLIAKKLSFILKRLFPTIPAGNPAFHMEFRQTNGPHRYWYPLRSGNHSAYIYVSLFFSKYLK